MTGFFPHDDVSVRDLQIIFSEWYNAHCHLLCAQEFAAEDDGKSRSRSCIEDSVTQTRNRATKERRHRADAPRPHQVDPTERAGNRRSCGATNREGLQAASTRVRCPQFWALVTDTFRANNGVQKRSAHERRTRERHGHGSRSLSGQWVRWQAEVQRAGPLSS